MDHFHWFNVKAIDFDSSIIVTGLTIQLILRYLKLAKIFSSTPKKPSKNLTCFILRRFELFLIHLQFF